jgi:hypothetical protein
MMSARTLTRYSLLPLAMVFAIIIEAIIVAIIVTVIESSVTKRWEVAEKEVRIMKGKSGN